MISKIFYTFFQLSKQFDGLVKGEFKFESDNEFNDFYSYLEKIRQHSLLSLPPTLALVSSVRKSSLKLELNPALSELKAVNLNIKLCKYNYVHIYINDMPQLKGVILYLSFE